MSEHPVISARGLTKAYRIWQDPSARLLGPIWAEAAAWLPGKLGDALQRRAHEGYRDFYALQDVSFEVRRGEAVGIVGRNGAGKSTLLQLIAGTLQPTTGEIEVRGRVAALLELGAGFNPEFTGRENVFLSGAVLGLSKAEMEARFDSVAAFADIGDFIEQPVKTYSSGMMMRLAFAVNTCVDPEVLIVDEALSVGDAPFQAKCFRRLRQLIDHGVSLLFVSHDLGTVRSICSRALWLKGGRAERWGEAKEVAREYEKFCWREQGVVTEAASAPETSSDFAAIRPATASQVTLPAAADAVASAGEAAAPGASSPASSPPPELLAAPVLRHADSSDRYGTGAVRIERLLCTDLSGQPANRFEFNQPVVLHYLLRVHQAVDSDIVIGVRVKDTKDNFIISAQDIATQHRLAAAPGNTLYASTTFRVPLTHGRYLVKTGIFGFQEGQSRPDGRYDYSRAVLWDIIEDTVEFEVALCPVMPLAGPVQLHAALHLRTLPA
jgi:lipopolysaccharide transport system ATP-binding protein